MIAVYTPSDGFPQVIASEGNTSFILDRPAAGNAALILVARLADGQETRLPLTWRTIVNLRAFIDDYRESFAGQITESNFLFLYDGGRFEIRLRSRSITMSANTAYQLAEALRAYSTAQSSSVILTPALAIPDCLA